MTLRKLFRHLDEHSLCGDEKISDSQFDTLKLCSKRSSHGETVKNFGGCSPHDDVYDARCRQADLIDALASHQRCTEG